MYIQKIARPLNTAQYIYIFSIAVIALHVTVMSDMARTCIMIDSKIP